MFMEAIWQHKNIVPVGFCIVLSGVNVLIYVLQCCPSILQHSVGSFWESLFVQYCLTCCVCAGVICYYHYTLPLPPAFNLEGEI